MAVGLLELEPAPDILEDVQMADIVAVAVIDGFSTEEILGLSEKFVEGRLGRVLCWAWF